MANRGYKNTLLYIDGHWTEGADRATREVVNPATGEVIGTVAVATAADLEQAARAAERQFREWKASSPSLRSQIIRKCAELLRERADAIAPLLTLEQGKPLAQARGEVTGAAEMLEWTAEEGRRTLGTTIPARDPHVMQYTVLEPIGPVAAFSPWNFPLNIFARKVACALAAGCTVVAKAAEETPAAAAAVVQCLADAGLPAGVLHLVFGDPNQISSYLIPHPAIRKVSFTGSSAVGKKLAALAGTHMKSMTSELGGHAPALVFADADVPRAARLLATSKYRNGGQGCGSPSRILVEESAFDEFLTHFTAVVKSVKVGDGFGPVDMGPLANARRLAAVEELIADALAHGATLAAGGSRIPGPGYFFEPTVLVKVPISARIMNEEPFGPIGVICTFRNLEEAVQEANRLPYGLASYAYTNSTRTARTLVRDVEAGMVSINHQGLAPPEVPFAGVKDSGIGAESGPGALSGYLVSKFVTQYD